MGNAHQHPNISTSESYDIIASYIRSSLRSKKILLNEKINEVIPINKHDWEGSTMLKAMREYCDILMRNCSININMVAHERHQIAKAIVDLKTTELRVRAAYLEMLRNWLVDSTKPMSWDRILICIAYTERLVTVYTKHQPDLFVHRAFTLTSTCIQFIDTQMDTDWKECYGGWECFEKKISQLIFQTQFDIPATSIEGCKREIAEDGTVYEEGYPQPESTSRGALIEQHPFVEHPDVEAEQYDILVSYIKITVQHRNEIEGNLDSFLRDINMVLVPEKDMAGSQLMENLMCLSATLLPIISKNYMNVYQVCASDINLITNPYVGKGMAWHNFDRMLAAYLIPANQELSWDRVIVVMEFTADLVCKVCREQRPGYLQRISDLCKIGAHFLNHYMRAWILKSGGWLNAHINKETLTEEMASLGEVAQSHLQLTSDDIHANQKLLAAEYNLITNSFHDVTLHAPPQSEAGASGGAEASTSQPPTSFEQWKKACGGKTTREKWIQRKELEARINAFKRIQADKVNHEETVGEDDVFD